MTSAEVKYSPVPGSEQDHCCSLRQACTCCCGCLCSAVIIWIMLYHALTYQVSVSNQPLPTETCVDKSDFLCGLADQMGMCSSQAEEMCKITCTGCIPFDAGIAKYYTYPAESIVEELAYAKTGSDIPESLHGIWWMDQAGYNKDACGENYSFFFHETGETLITFGDDAVWQPETRCVTPVYFNAGRRGHWASINLGNDTACCLTNDNLFHNINSFCFTDESMTEIEIWTAFKLPTPRAVLSAFGWIDAGNGYYYTPRGTVNQRMTKESWGWDRPTNALANWTRSLSEDQKNLLQSMLPSDLWDLVRQGIEFAEFTQRYPVFQIVDGDGQKTEHWEKWLEFINTRSLFNQVPGTVVIARREPITRNELAMAE